MSISIFGAQVLAAIHYCWMDFKPNIVGKSSNLKPFRMLCFLCYGPVLVRFFVPGCEFNQKNGIRLNSNSLRSLFQCEIMLRCPLCSSSASTAKKLLTKVINVLQDIFIRLLSAVVIQQISFRFQPCVMSTIYNDLSCLICKVQSCRVVNPIFKEIRIAGTQQWFCVRLNRIEFTFWNTQRFT